MINHYSAVDCRDEIVGRWRKGSPLENARATLEKVGRRLAPPRAESPFGGRHDLSRPAGGRQAAGSAAESVGGTDRTGEHRPAPRSPSVGPVGDARTRRASGRERLDATGARVRAVARGERATAGYATFANETARAATIVALESPAFDRVEMHGPAGDGTTTTRRLDSLEVLPGDSVAFGSGGRRLLLIGPRQSLRSGQLVGITVTFASGKQRVLPFRVVSGETVGGVPGAAQAASGRTPGG